MIEYIIGLLLLYRYLIIIPLTLLQGPLVMMLGGFLVRLGIFDFWPLYVALMVGDLLGDIIWYWFGYHFGESFIVRFGKYLSLTDEHVKVVRNLFHRYHMYILVVSKLTMGFGFAIVTLFTAGMSRMSFKKYLILNACGQFVWTALLMGVGYFLGDFFVTVNDALGRVTIIGLAVLIFLAVLGFGNYIRQRIMERYSS